MSPDAPSRSLAQRREALRYANSIRTGRADLKRRIQNAGKPGGRETIAHLLVNDEHPDRPLIETMKVWDLLLAAPGYGRVKTNKLLSTVRASPSKTVGGLSYRQRGELVQLIRTGAR